ncbi:MAG: Asr1405/Asl0597 family protein [Limnoraphis robusta]|jgi:hypothetical protein|uniref:Uncharacterized protein n=2 Tax=Limnoraphis robusta TaxID=1118279 RepID=A0A0F5YBD6_9CYAN|nr:Asr1405/Asl0597 family protein [Limnoraphis robusta]MCG5061624.1 hypothetical protein [Limnoraphis sp. WC205]KKD36048.1 hypothetical protein WN50_21930 [Limnoraphis robusta CS-951]MEA5495723.1 hypothetical protein [Limnoraphis robusta BA-68 BA1]MEA5521017.1 hypothetical protein [Limnoraphis robusta CCNP1315]MEA5540096.1 hypothetical protein [Limnoraphis robusta Tam1]
MFKLSPSSAVISPVDVLQGDRWIVYHRLQELMIPCWCPEDGRLWVEIHHGNHAILLRSAIQQFTASRLELVDWLERCWETDISPQGVESYEFHGELER